MQPKATAQSAVPVTIARAPKAWISREVAKPIRKLATADGSSRLPDSLIEAPKP